MTRSYKDSGAVYRVHIDHIYADGSGVWLTQTYGPYATRGAAKGQAAQRLTTATWDGQKAKARIEKSVTNWEQIMTGEEA